MLFTLLETIPVIGFFPSLPLPHFATTMTTIRDPQTGESITLPPERVTVRRIGREPATVDSLRTLPQDRKAGGECRMKNSV